MRPHYADDQVTLYHGDCLEVLTELSEASVDAVVTDPPYDLTAGKKGGTGAASVNLSSPYGRSRIGTGNGAGGFMGQSWDATGVAFDPETWRQVARVLKPGGHLLAFGGSRTWHRLAAAVEDAGFEIRDSIAWLYGSGFPKSLDVSKAIDKTDPDSAGLWEGWGTALKPSFEPIVVARKPLSGTVAANVLEHRTGALNIDGCRVGDGSDSQGPRPAAEPSATRRYGDRGGVSLTATPGPRGGSPDGRWPTNVVLDEDQAAELDQQSGVLKSGANPTRRGSDKFRNAYGEFAGQTECVAHRGANEGGASRFFPVFRYEAKAPSSERPSADGVAHPTVKPLELMRWLVRLVTPPKGLVLDPFAGSGTTAEACVHEHMHCITVEREADYLPLILSRLTKPIEVGFDFTA